MTSLRTNEELLDDLAPLAEGDPAARARHASTLAGDAESRDLVFDAEALVTNVLDAGSDHRSPEDLEARVLARLASGAPTPAVSPGVASGSTTLAPLAPAPRASFGAEPRPAPAPLRPTKRASLAPFVALFAAAGFVGLVALGGSAWWFLRGRGGETVVNTTTASWTGRIEAVFPDPSGASLGSGASRVTNTVGAEASAGQTFRTDDRTRARVRMSDGTLLFVDQATEVVFEDGGRRARVQSGVVVADVAHLDRATGVVFSTPHGRVEVLGTKLSITAADTATTVRVLRGRVRIANDVGATVELDAGEEGLLARGVAPSESFATTFSEFEDPEFDDRIDSQDVPGLGELRARRPGERQEQERPLTLAEHSVNVRIVGPVARTEIEEAFRNDDDATLEGVYRFPIPDGARIASLSLEVEGRWETGAFVTKDRARRIFQGVIAHATPHPDVPRPSQEWIWVPGPWRDPALLEWQRGGRFELRIFPIAGHSVRRVRLAYEQTLPVTANGRRYVYPLPSVRRGEARVGRFSFDARVANGADVRTAGYSLTESREGEASRLGFASDSFAPKGSITIEYALPNGDAELRSYAYRGPAAVPPGERAREDEPVRVAQQALADDARSYVSLAFRPRIPNATRFRATDYTVVLDSSQSMTGERWTRARTLATAFVRELDRRHRVRVVTCDLGCRAIEDALSVPGPELAARVDSRLTSVRPMGSSNLLAAIERASKGFDSDASRPRAVLYLGDGMGSVGVTDVGALELEIRDLSRRLGIRVDTVGIGEDADGRALAAVARGGAGHATPYLPGQSASGAAIAILEGTFGAALEHPELTLPAGLEAVAPSHLGTVRPGEELVVSARYSGAIRGEAILRGKVAGEPYERRFPIVLDEAPSSVNGFVPRAWANARIDDLDASNLPADRAQSIALSKSFGVLSRDTSLLVLESEAMVRAYGIDRTEEHVQFSGDALDEDVADAISAEPAASAGIGRLGDSRAQGFADDESAGPSSNRARGEMRASASAAPPAPMRSSPTAFMPAEEMAAPRSAPATTSTSRPRGPGSWMRVIWVRDARIDPSAEPSQRDLDAVATTRVAHDASPDSRDRTRDHARALAKAGRLDEALEVTESWLARDPNDVEALVLASDVVGRLGRPDESARLLAGTVDAEPNDPALHERLAIAFERAGRFEDACAHRLVLASLRATDPGAATQATSCATRLSLPHVADAIRSGSERIARRSDATVQTGDAENVRGEILVEASASGGGVDVSIVTPRGERASWLGGPRGTTARPSNGSSSGSVAIRTARAGTYQIEVTRSSGVTGPVRGELRIRALGTTRTVPFVLDDAHEAVARIVVSRHRETVPW